MEMKKREEEDIPEWDCSVEDLIKALDAGGHKRLVREDEKGV